MAGIAFDDLADVKAPEGDNLLIVDSLNLCFRYMHSGKTDFAEDLLATIKSFARSYACGSILILCDYKGSYYRKRIDPLYKANRKEKYKNQSEEDALAIQAFFKGYEEAIAYCKQYFPVIRIEGVEADDIAAYAVVGAKKKYAHIWMVSTDKDWDLLVDAQVSRFSYITRKETTLSNWREHYDIAPEKYIDYKVLQGDKGDNVPGIPGVGPKRAVLLIEHYGSAIDLYHNIPLPGTAKFIQNVNASEDRILVNFELMDLASFCEEAIGQEHLEMIDSLI